MIKVLQSHCRLKELIKLLPMVTACSISSDSLKEPYVHRNLLL